MDRPIARRDFLKEAPAAAGLLAAGMRLPAASAPPESPYPAIGAQPYTPVTDYPIRAKRFSEVAVSDAFWKPKITTNAEVTIPFEAQRAGAPGSGLSGNVLEAAIYSLETHPDAALSAQVRERVAALSRGEDTRRSLNNNGFEVAVAWYEATGERTLLDPAIKTAAALYEDFKIRKPPFSGGERDAIISAYSETCAVLMFMALNHRLFLATGEAKYIDVLERGMYNNALSGVSTAGNRFFYVNRLASAGDGRDERWERASLECCPPNLVRFLATMPGYIYAQDKRDAVYVNLYVTSRATFKVARNDLSLAVESDMPWGGRSVVTVTSNAPTRASIKLRVPGWARNQPTPGSLYAYADALNKSSVFAVNGKTVSSVPDRFGYVTIDRVWSTGDSITIEFPMNARKVIADTRVKDDRGRVAIERGPIVYCAEWPDCEGGSALDVLLDPRAELVPAAESSLGGGVTVLNTVARRLTKPRGDAAPLRLVPYFLWANRGPGQMSVWLATRELVPGDVGPAGGFIFYVNPNYLADGWRYLEAAPFDQSAGVPWGCFRRAIPGARGTAIGAGRQNTADIIASCNEPQSAAALCASLKLNGVTGWFLPSRDELAVLYANLKASDFGTRGVADNFSYWASTQATTDMAHHIDFADLGRQHYDDKDFPRRVRAIRAF